MFFSGTIQFYKKYHFSITIWARKTSHSLGYFKKDPNKRVENVLFRKSPKTFSFVTLHLEILGKSKPSLKAFDTLRNSKIKIKTRRDSIWFFLDHHWNINLFLNETLKLPLPQALSSIPRTFYPLDPLVQVFF